MTKSKTQDKAKTATKKPQAKAITFLERIKEIAKLYFVLWTDKSKEIALIKEKTVDIGSPVNVIHVLNGNGEITGNYREIEKENFSVETMYKTTRISKGKYKIHPVLCGFFHHYCERMQSKRDMIFKANKDKTKASKIYLKEIKCDLVNFNRICISFYLDDMIRKDFPAVKGTLKNVINNYFIVDNCEKGEISYITK